MDQRIRELCREASYGGVEAAERIILTLARTRFWISPGDSQTSYHQNGQKNGQLAAMIRFLGYLRWRGYKDLRRAVEPIPPVNGWPDAPRFSLAPFSSIGADLSKQIPIQVFAAAAGGLAARVAHYAGVEPEAVLDLARAARGEGAYRGARRLFLEGVHTPSAHVEDPPITSLAGMATISAARCLYEWVDGMNPRSHESNRSGDLHHAIFYGDVALGAECEAGRTSWDGELHRRTDGTESAWAPWGIRCPDPRRHDRGWWPSRGCMTKARRESKKAMLAPALFAVASMLCDRF